MLTPTISKIDIIKLAVPLVAPFRIALGVMTSANVIVIRIHTDAGLDGVGEGCPAWFVSGETPEIAIESAKRYARVLIGKNPLAIHARLAELDASLTHNTAVKSAFDLALYDLLGKQAGLPLYALLGGQNQVIYSNITIGINAPDVMARQARAIKDAGATMLKVKVGTGKADDVARLKAIRAALGEMVIRIDANQGWDVPTAIATLQALAQYDIQYCEQPVPYWDHEGMRRVREHSPIPIMADEAIFDSHDAFRLARMGACDYFNIKLAKAGGIHGALKINAVAESAGIKCMLGGMAETRLAVTAGAHLLAARPNIAFADLDSPLHHTEDPISGGVKFDRDGRVELSDAPGLGADVKPEALEKAELISI